MLFAELTTAQRKRIVTMIVVFRRDIRSNNKGLITHLDDTAIMEKNRVSPIK